jgi:hypothetical protein
MGQRHASGRKVGQDRDHGLFREPAVGGDGMFGGSNVVPQREQPGGEVRRGRSHDLLQAPVDPASDALPRFGMVGVAAGRTVQPRCGRCAVGAEWAGQGAGRDRRMVPAARAGRRSALAGRAPRPACGTRYAAPGRVAADRAGQHGKCGASRAERPVDRAATDRAQAPAA